MSSSFGEASQEGERATQDGALCICWICLDEDPRGMISPCQCKGSMAHVHEKCLNQWIQRQAADCRLNIPTCRHCGTAYEFHEGSCNAESEHRFAGPFEQIWELLRLANEVADAEDRATMIAGYMQRAVALASVLCVAVIGTLFILRFGLNWCLASPSRAIAQDEILSLWTASNPINVLFTFVSGPMRWWSPPDDFDGEIRARAEQLEPSASSISFAWFQVVAALQRAGEFRALSMCIVYVLREHLAGFEEDSLDASNECFKFLPLGIHIFRSVIFRLVQFGLLSNISPMVHSLLELLVWRVFASCTVVAVDLLAHGISVWRLYADLFAAVEADISTLRSSEHLRAGKLGFKSYER